MSRAVYYSMNKQAINEAIKTKVVYVSKVCPIQLRLLQKQGFVVIFRTKKDGE